MADQEANDAAAKQRIVSHMQNDHHDSVIRYLEYYHKLSSWSAQSGRITDVDLSGMTFSCGSKTYRTAFSPPLGSYRDARERVVAMDKECLAGLKRSEITVSEFVPPLSPQALMIFTVTTSTFLAYHQRSWFQQTAIVEQLLGSGFAKFSWTIQPYLFWGMMLLHSGEVLFLAMPRLRKHSVSVGSSLWLKWIAFWFIEGVFCQGRFDKLVKEKRQAKAKQQH